MRNNMTVDQEVKCHAIIHTASTSAAAVGAGLAQIPCSDSVPIGAIQTAMIVSLGGVFGITIDESAAKAMVASGVAGMVGRGIAQVLVGWIPGVGNATNAATAAAVTEGLGWLIAEEMARGELAA